LTARLKSSSAVLLCAFPEWSDLFALPKLDSKSDTMIDQRPALQDLQIPRIPMRLIASIAAVLLLIVLAWTSCYTVQAESEGVVLRFGKFLKTVEPGLHFKLPFGIDRVTVLPTRRQLKLEFGFVTPGYTNPYQPGEDAREERSMVTGDLTAPWMKSSQSAGKTLRSRPWRGCKNWPSATCSASASIRCN
jgi:hypothetical protein